MRASHVCSQVAQLTHGPVAEGDRVLLLNAQILPVLNVVLIQFLLLLPFWLLCIAFHATLTGAVRARDSMAAWKLLAQLDDFSGILVAHRAHATLRTVCFPSEILHSLRPHAL